MALPLEGTQHDPATASLGPGFSLLRGFAEAGASELLSGIHQVAARAPFRQMQTPGGFLMSVAMTNCGDLGWVTDRSGYRYTADDPQTGRRWPPMPAAFAVLAREAAAAAGFEAFVPDACLVNRYAPGARMSLHQDRNEMDFAAPIVSVSLGLPATFLWGGTRRSERPVRLGLQHADVVVWGGPARLSFHGILPVKDGEHPGTGQCRYNLTFRKAG